MQTLIEMLRNHDWYFEYSDDHKVWQSGVVQRAEINAEAERLGETHALERQVVGGGRGAMLVHVEMDHARRVDPTVEMDHPVQRLHTHTHTHTHTQCARARHLVREECTDRCTVASAEGAVRRVHGGSGERGQTV